MILNFVMGSHRPLRPGNIDGYRCSSVANWRAECPLTETICKKSEKRGKNWGAKRVKIGNQKQKLGRFFNFTSPDRGLTMPLYDVWDIG